MSDDLRAQARREIVDVSHRLYERRMVAGRGGNVSVRLANETVLITPHGACLGLVREQDVMEIDLEGRVLSGEGRPSTETRLHLAVYNHLPARAVIHVHPIYATAFTLHHAQLTPLTFETLFALGQVQVIPQETPTVLDTGVVVDALRVNNVALLRKHGAVIVSENLEEAYFLAELLEEAAQIVTLAGRERERTADQAPAAAEAQPQAGAPLPFFSDEHIAAIVTLVNDDQEAQKRGVATRLTTRLGIRLDETGQLHNIHLEEGRVTQVTHEDDVDFLISGPGSAWRQVFGGQIDPFVAVTQRRLKLRGDLGKLSRWYSPFYRVFELWKLVPVE